MTTLYVIARTIKTLMPRHNWSIVESGVLHHKHNPYFWWNTVDIWLVLDQWAQLDFYNATSAKQQCQGKQVYLLGFIIPTTDLSSLCSYSWMLNDYSRSREASNTNFRSTTHRTVVEYFNYYTTKVTLRMFEGESAWASCLKLIKHS